MLSYFNSKPVNLGGALAFSWAIWAETRQHSPKRFSELPVRQSVNKWVAAAVQHGQSSGDDEEIVGEWARASSERQTQGSHEMRKPTKNKCSIYHEKNQSYFHLFPTKKEVPTLSRDPKIVWVSQLIN